MHDQREFPLAGGASRVSVREISENPIDVFCLSQNARLCRAIIFLWLVRSCARVGACGHAYIKEGILDRTIARLNIERYKELLKKETEESKRQTIMRLLAEEETKLLSDPEPTTRKRSA